jgi:L-threonylcarbamoyladenylate synthase
MKDDSVEACARAVRAGGVVAYPTEAVFGLGCDPLDEAAVMRLLRLKERDVAAGLILIGATVEQLAPFMAPLDPASTARILPTWPGPITWVVPASPQVPAWIRGAHDSVALRVTAHPEAAELCRQAGTALVSTSANLHGAAPVRSARDVEKAFGTTIDAVLDGPCGEQDRPTEIRDGLTGAVLRAG